MKTETKQQPTKSAETLFTESVVKAVRDFDRCVRQERRAKRRAALKA